MERVARLQGGLLGHGSGEADDVTCKNVYYEEIVRKCFVDPRI